MTYEKGLLWSDAFVSTLMTCDAGPVLSDRDESRVLPVHLPPVLRECVLKHVTKPSKRPSCNFLAETLGFATVTDSC